MRKLPKSNHALHAEVAPRYKRFHFFRLSHALDAATFSPKLLLALLVITVAFTTSIMTVVYLNLAPKLSSSTKEVVDAMNSSNGVALTAHNLVYTYHPIWPIIISISLLLSIASFLLLRNILGHISTLTSAPHSHIHVSQTNQLHPSSNWKNERARTDETQFRNKTEKTTTTGEESTSTRHTPEHNPIKLHFEYFSAKTELEKIAASFIWTAQKSEIRIKVDGTGLIYADRSLLHRAVNTLIMNSLSRAQSGDTIQLFTVSDDNTCTISVSYPNSKEATNQQAYIFDRFYRMPPLHIAILKNTNGLDLPSLRLIMTLHDGTARAENIDNKTFFHLLFPKEKKVMTRI